jgi:DtxR family transcriptional regulator, Mn-dependent transcriptional regulator
MNNLGLPKNYSNESRQDYLKNILVLTQAEGSVSTLKLAEILQVKPASVTMMLKRLAELGLVNHVPYQGVLLTEEGHQVALEVLHHHELLEQYLHRALGYSKENAHAEAERLEHHISETFETRIAAWLNQQGGQQ